MAKITAYKHKNKKGQVYYLHNMKVKLKNGNGKVVIYYFARKVIAKRFITELPKGYKVIENKGSGLPLLKKRKGFFK